MKTVTLFLAVIFCMVNVKVFSQSENLNHLTENNELGLPSVVISVDNRDNPVKKNEYTYDSEGNRLSKTYYLWQKGENRWIESSKTEFEYNEEGQLASCSHRKWDSKRGQWENDCENMIYLYDGTGKLLAVKHLKGDMDHKSYLTKK